MSKSVNLFELIGVCMS